MPPLLLRSFALLLPDAPRPAESTEGGCVKDYEVVYIFDTQLDEEAVSGKLDRFHALLTEGGGEITETDHWGRRQLAYEVRKQTAGNYVVVQFKAPPAPLPEFERLLKLDEGLLRYMMVLHEGEPTAPMSIVTRSDRKDEDGDDDEEDD
jgi:small subunit ribosomal protein S6